MWSDNETANDLIGFKVHSDLVLDVITDTNLLPVVLGVFGDWGGGKSSIMKMLEKDLASEKYSDVICLYFNGWMFEGYEDAKTALLSSILIELGENKRFGPKVRDKVVGLLKRIKGMELAKLGVKHIGVPLIAGALTGGAGAIPAALATLIPWGSSDECKTGMEAEKHSKGDGEKKDDKINWLDLIKSHSGKPDLLEIKKFRKDFDKLLDETDIKSLVILIDDLDRCLPERIIETLEAIKLFAAVSKTAFVIGADPRIVRHAIATRYVKRQLSEEDASRYDESDMVKDYLEKLIQIPYHLPRLSPAEIETYVNLLLCQKSLGAEECAAVLGDWTKRRKGNFYASCQYGTIKESLKDAAMPGELEGRLAWSSAIAPVITEGLKGNPRQVKRLLNAMLLRQRLAKVAGISIRDEVLAKLMVLEYTHPLLFEELNRWQSIDSGYPKKLRQLEETALAEKDGSTSGDDGLKEWRNPSIQKWFRMHPPLSDVDLRDYFWLVRDKTGSTLTGLTMVSPLVRLLFDQLTGGKKGEILMAAKEAAGLGETEQEVLMGLLEQHVQRHPDRTEGSQALRTLIIDYNVDGAAQVFFRAIKSASPSQTAPGVAKKIKEIADYRADSKDEGYRLLEDLAKNSSTKVGMAAAKALKG